MSIYRGPCGQNITTARPLAQRQLNLGIPGSLWLRISTAYVACISERVNLASLVPGLKRETGDQMVAEAQ